ncbi:helix-turn-helix domain-containing protein [Saccharothrix luteola]|uniref:helix-turn-helix domain-containing protein n=1 Tax=Saccharothrix luteola TaxID=2893018 RepID=UPI001E42F853|nr:helix-turn-helix transcriptional regulator [Saccharothrix luteola]MCC8250281.1 helix-turn-helix domain-containing protein [Saccharothrix luteola]
MAVGTTRAKRRLGRHVKPIVERAGLKPAEVADLVKTSKDTVNRLLSGDHLPRYPTFLAIMMVLKATDEELGEGTALWERANVDAVVVEHASALSPGYLRFRMDEGEAAQERSLDPSVIPGILQVGGYAEELGRCAPALTAGKGWTAQAAAERRDRQGLLSRPVNPLHLHALIDEAALHRVVGSRELMVEQLTHLLAVAEHDHVTLQVIPFETGAYGPQFGALTLLDYPEPEEPLSVFVEGHSGIKVVENERVVSKLAAAWDDVARRALDPRQSAKRIREVRGTRYA